MSEAAVKDYLGVKRCRVCGKEFVVLYPNLWAYKIPHPNSRDDWFCSWSCMRADEKKRGEKNYIMRLSDEQRQRAVEIALEGGNPREYLEKLGVMHPYASWNTIRQKLKEKDPETWAKIPDQYRIPGQGGRDKWKNKAPEAKPVAAEEAEPAAEPAAATGAPAEPEKEPESAPAAEADDMVAKIAREHGSEITSPLSYGGFEVCAIRNETVGEFYWDKKFGMLDWRTPEGEEVSGTPEFWSQYAGMFPVAMAILGVRRNDENPA